MRQTLTGPLVLLASLGLMGLAPGTLELARLPPDQTRAGEPPAVPDWRALARAPAPARPTAPPEVTLQAAESLPELGHFSDAEFLAEIARRQGRAAAEALVLRRGSFELAELARAAADPAVLEQDGAIFTLRRPLVIRRSAALVLPEGSVLRLATGDGAFLVNGGQLILQGAQVTSWDARRGGPSELEHDRRFRPFLAAIGGSWTEIADSTLSHLGYDAAKSYGLSLVSGPSSLAAAGPPKGRITGSRIVGNYYGLYSYEADGLVIAANAFVDNIVYGIDPHDRSRRLLIADNTATGTRRKHGIVVSRGVSESWIVGNRAIGNAGTGIVVDADFDRQRRRPQSRRRQSRRRFQPVRERAQPPVGQPRDRQSQERAPDPQRLGDRGPPQRLRRQRLRRGRSLRGGARARPRQRLALGRRAAARPHPWRQPLRRQRAQRDRRPPAWPHRAVREPRLRRRAAAPRRRSPAARRRDRGPARAHGRRTDHRRSPRPGPVVIGSTRHATSGALAREAVSRRELSPPPSPSPGSQARCPRPRCSRSSGG